MSSFMLLVSSKSEVFKFSHRHTDFEVYKIDIKKSVMTDYQRSKTQHGDRSATLMYASV